MEDKQFIVQTAINGLAEVEIGGLAMDKATSRRVRELAQRIVLDYYRANIELIELARKRGIDLPDILDAGHRIVMSRLRRLFSEEFDREFMKTVTEVHQRSILSCREECQKGEDQEIKAFALKRLSSLESHHAIAASIVAF